MEDRSVGFLWKDTMTEPNFDRPPRAIAEFAGRPDFPQSTVGEFLDIGGYTGVVVEIVRDSIKVRSPEGATQRFNYHTLRRLYGPRIEPEPDLSREMAQAPAVAHGPTEVAGVPTE